MIKNYDSSFKKQLIPLLLTVGSLIFLSTCVFGTISLLNHFNLGEHISTRFQWTDVLIGATIYLKTSVDFAIFMGLLMAANAGWKNRIAIELGTALGNGLGTILILILWVIFKEFHILLAIMIFFAALILFELAAGGLEHFNAWEAEGGLKRNIFLILQKFLDSILKIIHPFTSRLLPDLSTKLNNKAALPWKKLFFFALSVPFILGLDDFAGYVPLFNVVNVFGFAIGVMSAHMLLNIALFINPKATTKWVKNEWISFLGTLAFIGLAVWGIIEAIRTLI